jgi:uroporphyrinogen-III decarboxylase
MCDFFHARGLPVILHTDGRLWPLIPLLIEAGFDCLQPLEVKAGMDLVELKHLYGDRLAFMGGIDVRAMADPDPAAIEAEIARKIPVAKRGGGYIYHCDHSVPDNVSWEQYCRVMELVREYGTY